MTAQGATAAGRGYLVRDALAVARFELADSLRTRRILAMLLLFCAGGGLAAWGFSRVVAGIEDRWSGVSRRFISAWSRSLRRSVRLPWRSSNCIRITSDRAPRF